jgi:small conductance mechanosensitive channel
MAEMPAVREMFRTKSHSWQQAGLAAQLRLEAAQQAKRARRQLVVLLPLLAGVIVAYAYRDQIKGYSLHIRIATVILLLILGWGVARALGRALGPMLFRRLDPATAGTVGFLVRLVAVIITLLFALSIAGLRPETLLAASAFTAVIVGLASQQTLGNVFAGIVLLSARPFRVGDRIRLQAGPLAGQLEGTVASLGLLFTDLARGEETIMIPNTVVLSSAIVPLREPEAVDLLARLAPGVKPSQVQHLLDEQVSVPTRAAPHIELVEVDADEVVVRVTATPASPSDGPQLADEILAAMAEVVRDGDDDRNGGAAHRRDGAVASDGAGPGTAGPEDAGEAPSPDADGAPVGSDPRRFG